MKYLKEFVFFFIASMVLPQVIVGLLSLQLEVSSDEIVNRVWYMFFIAYTLYLYCYPKVLAKTKFLYLKKIGLLIWFYVGLLGVMMLV